MAKQKRTDVFQFKKKKGQECIPVGCIPSAAVAAAGGGVCIPACTGQGWCLHCGVSTAPPHRAQNDRRL